MTYGRCLTLLLALIVGVLFTSVPEVKAEATLGVQPLQYREELQKGEVKKAYVDVTNPSAQPVVTSFGVQGFRQLDGAGNLAFYDDERLRQGIRLDYDEVEIPARKTLRLYFVVDGSKLPRGDVFAVIFATTKPEQGAVAPSVRLGTLLILTNETPGARQARIESLETPLLQIGETLTGEVKIRNTASPRSASGFFPKVVLTLWPFGPTKTLTGPLVYAGNTRTLEFKLPSNQLGIVKLRASYGQSYKERWVVLITGVWRWVGIGLLVVVAGAGLAWRVLYRRRRATRR